MKKYLQSPIFTTGLAIFAMLFGAGNLIFPTKAGVVAGDQTWIALLGFLISGIFIPLMGLVGMVFFDGDYKAFFHRVDKIPGDLLIFFCMLVIGPLLVMPRIMALTYKLMEPFINGGISRAQFSILFAILTFVCCYKKEAILNLLGKILSPLKLITLGSIIAIGLWTAKAAEISTNSLYQTFKENFIGGYQTLDLLGAIFFAYIIIHILKQTLPSSEQNHKAIAKIMFYGGLIGGALLALVYIGMAYMGAFHGQGMDHSLGEGEVFKEILMRVLGKGGTLFMGLTVFIACLSTMIALASVVTEYLFDIVQQKRCTNPKFNTWTTPCKFDYTILLIIVVSTAAFIAATLDIDMILSYSAPIIFMVYPAIAILTFCNIAYKLWGFEWVKLPTAIALAWGIYSYGPGFIQKIRGSVSQEEIKAVADSPIAEM